VPAKESGGKHHGNSCDLCASLKIANNSVLPLPPMPLPLLLQEVNLLATFVPPS